MLHKLIGAHVAMPGRDHAEGHRAATMLELLYDLVGVFAIAFAATSLHHAINENHAAAGILSFTMIFFTIFWAWLSFTWFASQYDTDDTFYRLAVFTQMVGYVVLAAGVKAAFTGNWDIVTFGYVIMRVAQIALWIRVMKSAEDKATAIRTIVGTTVCQIAWVLAVLFLPKSLMLIGFITLVICELLVPYFAKPNVKYHRHHIIERYGLLTIIVLGESLLAVINGLVHLFAHFSFPLFGAIVGGFLILFSMWWFYFDEEEHPALQYSKRAFLWGYGHFVVYASLAATGVGLAVVVDQLTDHSKISQFVAQLSLAIPVALFLIAMWFIHDMMSKRSLPIKAITPVSAIAILLAAFLPFATLTIGIIMVVSVAFRLYLLKKSK